MAVAYKSAGAGAVTEASGGNLNPACPATVDANDILIAHVAYEGTSETPSTPSGWTLLGGPYTVESAYRHWIFGKIAAGTEDGAAVSFGTPAVTTLRVGRVYSFSGWTSGLIFGNVPAAGFAHLSHATDPQMPTVTTTITGALAVACTFQADDNAQASATGESGGDWTEAVAAYTQLATTPDTALHLQTCTPTGNPGTVSGGTVATANDPCGVIAFEIRPSAAAQAVTGVTISSGNQRFAPTVAVGAVAVVGGTVASGNQRFAPVLRYAVVGASIASTLALFAPTVQQVVVTAFLSPATTLFAPTVVWSQDVAGATIASGNQRFAPLVSIPIARLVDSFPSLDTNVWDVQTETNATVAVVSGRLRVTSDTGRGSGLARGTIVTKQLYDLTGGALLIEVFPGDNSPANAHTDLYLENQASPFENLFISVDSVTDEIFFEYNGDSQTETFDPVQDRWWRVRHDQGTNKVHLETAPDGATWTSRRNDTPASSITNIMVFLHTRWNFDTPANETPTEFDNVNIFVVLGATLASGNQLFAPTIEAAAQNVTGAHVGSTVALTAPAVAYAVVAGTIASGNQSFAPTVTTGAVTIIAGTVASGSQLFAPTITTGAVAVTGGTIAAGNQRFAPTVSYAVTTATIASGNQRFAPTVRYEVAGATIASGLSLFAPTLTVGAVDVAGAHIASTLTMFAATVQVEGGVASDFIPSTLTMFAPTIVAEPAVTTGHITSTAQTFAASVRYLVVSGTIASGNTRFPPTVAYGVTTGTRASGLQMFAPSISSTSTITGGTIASGAQTFAPTVRRVVTTSTIPSGNQRFAPRLAYAVVAGTRASGAVMFAPLVALGTFVDTSFIPSGAELFPPFVGDREPSQTTQPEARDRTFTADGRDLTYKADPRVNTWIAPGRS